MPILLSSPEPTPPIKPPTVPTTDPTDPTRPPLPPIAVYDHNLHFPGLSSIAWTGWDGSTWDLWCQNQYDLWTGVALGPRVRGLHFGQMDEWITESPNVDGGTYLGYRMKPREVFLTFRVFQYRSSQEWLEHDKQFWRSMLPVIPGVRGPGRLTVTQPSGESRWLELYPKHAGDHEYERDPSRFGWATYGQTFTAMQPFWQGEAQAARTFTNTVQSGFFGGVAAGSGPPFVIGKGATLGAAMIDNPGDDFAWPVWTLTGPFDSARIGVPGQMTDISISVPAGRSLTVNSDPTAQTVTDEAGNVVMPTTLSGAPFAPIPPGVAQPIVAELVSAQTGGSIRASLSPRYHRAW